MTMTDKVELNWDHVRDSLEELEKEISDKPKFNKNETPQDFWSGIRSHLTNFIDYNHDGWPVQEIFISFDKSSQGVPVEVAGIVIDCLVFCKQNDLDLTDIIKTLLTEGK